MASRSCLMASPAMRARVSNSMSCALEATRQRQRARFTVSEPSNTSCICRSTANSLRPKLLSSSRAHMSSFSASTDGSTKSAWRCIFMSRAALSSLADCVKQSFNSSSSVQYSCSLGLSSRMPPVTSASSLPSAEPGLTTAGLSPSAISPDDENSGSSSGDTPGKRCNNLRKKAMISCLLAAKSRIVEKRNRRMQVSNNALTGAQPTVTKIVNSTR
mmetsp:Transcript_2963/g.4117  ORF Transcript_2963/g.4117 Transcript_2963/m.4117 type:complete len:216 (-) Transcript_2963:2410-3057(-)